MPAPMPYHDRLAAITDNNVASAYTITATNADITVWANAGETRYRDHRVFTLWILAGRRNPRIN